ASPRHTLRLTYDHLDSEMDGEALSSLSATTLAVTAHDETQRDRVSLDWRFTDFAGLDDGSISAYWQDATTRQVTYEDRATLADRERDVTFDNTVYGVAGQGAKTFGSEAARHRVTFGAGYQTLERTLNPESNLSLFGPATVGNLYATPPVLVDTSTFDRSIFYKISEWTHKSVFASDTIEFGDHWSVLLGARHVDYENLNWN
ncbi:hypothetical protein LTR94_031201, partial [Friedmanniomyces endolithicus]